MQAVDTVRRYLCDVCGAEMITQNCKITCPNCGYRWDCSDLTLQIDEPPAPHQSSADSAAE